MTRASFLHRPRPALAGIAFLACLAVALPLLSGPGPDAGAVTAIRGFVPAERPIDRILAGTALGSRPIAPAPAPPAPVAMPAAAPSPPRLVQPARLKPAAPDAAPDLRIAWLSVTAGYPPVDLPVLAATAQDDWTASPRRKPDRAPDMPAIDIVTRPLPPPVTQPIPEPEAEPRSDIAILLPGTDPVPDFAPAPAAPAPRIALVVTAAGLHEATTRRAIDALPGGITLAFAPIGRYSSALAQEAIADGHTVLVEIPMEPINPRRDPGEALTLRVDHPAGANIARLDKALATVPGAAGISSYLGAKFSRSEQAAAPVIDRLAARGLFLFENQPTGLSRLGALARSRTVPYAAAATALDAERGEMRMLERLSLLEARARREGVAIGVATAYRESVSALERWVAQAQRRGIVFVPVTQLDDAG